MSLLSPATASFLASASASPVSSGVPDVGLQGYLINLVVVLALLAAFGWALTKFGKGRLLAMPVGLKGRDLKVEDRLPIDPQRALLVVSYGGRRWLVGMTQYSINPVAELEPTGGFDAALEKEVGK